MVAKVFGIFSRPLRDGGTLQTQLRESIYRQEFLEWLKKQFPEIGEKSALAARMYLAWVEGYRQAMRHEIGGDHADMV